MVGRWCHAVLALALVLAGVGLGPRLRAAEGGREALHTDALARGAAASVKRAHVVHGEIRMTLRAAPAMLPAEPALPAADRSCAIAEPGAPPAGRIAREAQAAPARAPPARA